MNPKDPAVIEIKQGVSFGISSGTVMEVTKAAVEPDSINKALANVLPYAIWGKNNNYPQELIDDNKGEVASVGALRFKINAHFGKGLFFYRVQVDDKGFENRIPIPFENLPPAIKEFWWMNDMNNFFQGIIKDFEWFNHYNAQYIPNKAKNAIVNVKWQRAVNTRIGKRDTKTGEIKKFYLSSKWPNPTKDEYAEVPAFNPYDPFKHPNAIYQHKLVSIDRDYYPDAEWHSNKRWLTLAKKIPHWINANIDNSANIKYHVEIPEQYFIDLYPDSNYNSKEETIAARKTAEAALKAEIDTCLTGVDNPSKIFYTKFAVDPNTGTVIPGWKITELKGEMKDGAWLNAYSTAAAAITTGHGSRPSLTGMVLSNNLNVGSGSDTREQFNFYMQLNTVIPRQTTLEVWDFLKRFNRWPEDIHLGYKDIILQTVDQNKSGYLVERESSPTSNNE
jgi:hypothetical protein